VGTVIQFLAGFLSMAVIVAGVTVAGWWPRAGLELMRRTPTTVVLGASKIVVPTGAVVGVQVDRVIRDVAWTGSRWDERVPFYRVPTAPEDLVPYMEGVLVGELMRYAQVRVQPLAPTVARFDRRDGMWYAPDADGQPRFALDPTAAEYRSARRLREDLLEMPDTHGFNSIAAAAARARPFLAVACMDLASMADAARYLAERGIRIYGPTDRFASRLLGYRLRRPHAAVIVGSAPIRAGPDHTAIIGGQPLEIRLGETVVAQWTDTSGASQYNDTPWRYFSELVARYFLDIPLVRVRAEAGQLERVLAEARRRGAGVVAVRVGKGASMDEVVQDAKVLAAWLSENPRHRAVLFHSAPYEPGYQLFFKFPKQTTFGDLDPVLKP
jgi:hypothetical protein